MNELDAFALGEDSTNAVAIRRMTEAGVEQFRNYLSRVKSGETLLLPKQLLTDEANALQVDRRATLTFEEFPTTLAMVKFLHPTVEALTLSGKYYDAPLWTWISAFYFDVICPVNAKGQRKIGQLERYILPANREYRQSNNHLLAAPMRMYSRHGEDRMKLFLYTPPYEQSRAFVQIMNQQELASNSNLLDAFNILYWDEAAQRPKRGSIIRSPGSMDRFITLMNQFNRTYDLFSMTGKQIIALLPKEEFGRWMKV